MKKIKVLLHAKDCMPKAIKKGNWIDLRTTCEYELHSGHYHQLKLGVSMKLPEGYEAIITPRSSTFSKYGIIQANGIGVIDNSYCGDADEWQFPAYATRDVVIPAYTRICQFRIQKIQPEIEFTVVKHLDGKNRGGFGSTGV